MAQTKPTTSQVTGLTGELKMWPTSVAPTGYLICDGSAVSRTTYSSLFGIIGTTFGSGDGSTTFNLPDYRDRMPIGAGTTYNPNSKGGSKDAVVVSHTHSASVTDPGHLHNPAVQGINWPSAGQYLGDGSSAFSGSGGAAFGPGGTSFYTNTSTTGISVSNASAGVSGTGANLPPYIGIYFIIRWV